MAMITQFLKRLLDLVLPPQPIEQLTPESFLEKTERARRTVPSAEYAWSLAPLRYKTPFVREAVLALKYKESVHAARLLAQVLHPFLLEHISDMHLFGNTEKILLVPIPLARKRLRERGYNQALLLAQELEKLFESGECVVVDNALTRIKDTPSQTRTMSREERFENIAGCFSVPKPDLVQGKTVVLIDDVITTGATVSEARRTLLAAGSGDVLALAAAH